VKMSQLVRSVPCLLFATIVLVLLGVCVGVTVNHFFGVWWMGVPVLACSVGCMLWGALLELRRIVRD